MIFPFRFAQSLIYVRSFSLVVNTSFKKKSEKIIVGSLKPTYEMQCMDVFVSTSALVALHDYHSLFKHGRSFGETIVTSTT